MKNNLLYMRNSTTFVDTDRFNMADLCITIWKVGGSTYIGIAKDNNEKRSHLVGKILNHEEFAINYFAEILVNEITKI